MLALLTMPPLGPHARAESAGLSLRETARFLVGQAALPGHRIDTADFDADGLPELVLAQSNADLFVVSLLGAAANGAKLEIKQSFVGQGIRPLAAAASDIDGPILAVKESGFVDIFRGWPLSHAQRVQVDILVNDMRLVDVEGDGRVELLVVRSDGGGGAHVRCFDLSTGALRWSHPLAPGFPGRRLHVIERPGQNVQLVATGMPGYLIDGASGVALAPILGDIGNLAALARVDPGPDLLVHAWSGALRALEVGGWTQAWEVPFASPPSVLFATDLNGNGDQEILFQTEGGHQIQALTHLGSPHAWQVPFPRASGLGSGPFLPTLGSQVLVVRSQLASDQPQPIGALFNVASGSAMQELPNLRAGPYQVTRVPDEDRLLLAQAATTLNASFDAVASGLLRLVDGETGAELWRTPRFPVGHLLDRASFAAVHAVNFHGARPPLLVVLGQNGEGRRVIAGFAADTGELEWATDQGSTQGLSQFQQGVAHDADDDGTIDSIYTCSWGQGIEEFSVSGGASIWHSGPLSLGSCDGLVIARSEGVTAVTASFGQALQAYDVTTRELVWTMGPSPARRNIAWIEDSEGAELAVIAGWDRIDFYRFGAKASHRHILVGPAVRTVAGVPGSGLAHLVVGDAQGIGIVDGRSGQTLARRDGLGPVSHPMVAVRLATDRARLGAGTAVGVFGFDLEITDVILQAPFE